MRWKWVILLFGNEKGNLSKPKGKLQTLHKPHSDNSSCFPFLNHAGCIFSDFDNKE